MNNKDITMEEELKPCPFCGGEAKSTEEINKEYLRFSITCSCGASMSFDSDVEWTESNISMTVSKWNKRYVKK